MPISLSPPRLWRTRDLRSAVRSLAKNPATTAAVVIALALGIGANTVVFSVIDSLLLRGVPGIADQHELVAVYSTGQDRNQKEPVLRKVAYADYLDFGDSSAVSGLAAFSGLELSLTHGGPAVRIAASAASANYFDVLGVTPERGRFFHSGDAAGEPVAVVSHGLWQQRFGGDPGLVGQVIRLNGQPVTVIGISPRGFQGTSKAADTDLWMSFDTFRSIAVGIYAQFHGAEDREQTWLNLVGRRAPGVSLAETRSALEVVAARLSETYPETHEDRGVKAFPLSEVTLGTGNRQKVARYSGLLLGLVAVVLLVACLDVASLLLARTMARRREIAIRLSLGAGRGRVMRLLMTESLGLALLGGAAGLALAAVSLPLVEQLRLPVEVELNLSLDPRLVGFALLVSLLCGLFFGSIPALRGTRTDLISSLRGGKASGRRSRFALAEGLVAVQVALALVVLIASGLMLRTLRALDGVELGYQPENTLAASLDLASAGYKGPRVTAFYEELSEHLRRLPGARSVSMASALPMAGSDLMVNLVVSLEDAAPLGEGEPPRTAFHAMVGRDYFRTVDMEILEGRDFASSDTASSPAVAIVNETLAKRFWPDRDAVGRRLSLVQTEEPFEVVGVVSNAKYAGVKEDAAGVLYLYHAQQEKSFLGPFLAPSMTLLVRADGDARRLIPDVRATVQAMDPYLPVFSVTTLPEILSGSVAVERQMATLISAFAVLAVLLVMVGLYGVVSQAAARRSKEIAVRVACGARPESVLRLMLGRSTMLSGVGVIAGLAAAALASRAVAGYLYGVTHTDPVIYAGVALGLIVLTVAVSAIPARRAANADPVAVLRESV